MRSSETDTENSLCKLIMKPGLPFWPQRCLQFHLLKRFAPKPRLHFFALAVRDVKWIPVLFERAWQLFIRPSKRSPLPQRPYTLATSAAGREKSIPNCGWVSEWGEKGNGNIPRLLLKFRRTVLSLTCNVFGAFSAGRLCLQHILSA